MTEEFLHAIVSNANPSDQCALIERERTGITATSNTKFAIGCLIFLFALAAGVNGEPRIRSITLDGVNVNISGDCGDRGNSYYVLASTNPAMPTKSWTRIATSFYGSDGTFSFTDVVNPEVPQKYYRVQSVYAIPSSPSLDRLDELGIEWSWGPELPGVATPVTVKLPLGGIQFRSFDGTLRESWFMDCELALALHRMVQLLAARGVVEVVDFGIYNYRCIGGGEPPDCPLGISMHARALAVDIAAVVTKDLGRVSVKDDWVIDADGGTCATRARGPRDAFLHGLLCDIYNARIFTIHLSPNFNSDHRDHWHLDLTPESGRFIR